MNFFFSISGNRKRDIEREKHVNPIVFSSFIIKALKLNKFIQKYSLRACDILGTILSPDSRAVN